MSVIYIKKYFGSVGTNYSSECLLPDNTQKGFGGKAPLLETNIS
jgi:hypothetical protein